MAINVITLFLIIFTITGVLFGSTQFAYSAEYVASFVDDSVDSASLFDALDGVYEITTVVIDGIPYAIATVNGDDDGIQIINILDPTQPLAVASIVDNDVDSVGGVFDRIHTPYDLTTIVIDGSTYAIVASNQDDGFTIIDISTPSDPRFTSVIGGIDAARGITSVVINDIPYVLVTSHNDADVNIYDISTPSLPDLVATVTDNIDGFRLTGPHDITTVVVGGLTYALVTSSTDDLIDIMDISDPANPVHKRSLLDGGTGSGTYFGLNNPQDITTVVVNEITYALVTTSGDQTLTILDISNLPGVPTEINDIRAGDIDSNDNVFGSFNGAHGITTVVVNEITYALVTSGGANLVQIIDITTRGSPTLAASFTDGMGGFDILANAKDVTTITIGESLYALVTAPGDDGITIIDITSVDGLPVITLYGDNPQYITVGEPYDELGATCDDDEYELDDPTGKFKSDSDNVNTSMAGTYFVSYTCTLDDVIFSVVEREVIVLDVVLDETPPVISLTSTTETIELGDEYVELVATCDDETDGTLNVTVTSTVDTSIVETYQVIYDCEDIAGNTAQEIITVIVEDTIAPIFTVKDINGNFTTTIQQNGNYTVGTIEDIFDLSTILSETTDVTSVNTTDVGSFDVTYTVTDVFDNAGEIIETVTVEEIPVEEPPLDTTDPPILSINGTTQTIELGDDYVELGATCYDNQDGDLTDEIVIIYYAPNQDRESFIDTSILGTHTVYYECYDIDLNYAANATIDVDVVEPEPDTTPPVLTLDEVVTNGSVAILQYDIYTPPTATCIDDVDEDISGSVIITENGNSNTVGNYTINYSCTDSSLNISTMSIIVYVLEEDITRPDLYFLETNTVDVIIDDPIDFPEATCVDIIDGDISENITIDASAVDTSTEGRYYATYSCSDSAQNINTLSLTVNVVSGVNLPVITLYGDDPQYITVDEPYEELGAICFDEEDGELTISSGFFYIFSSSVDTSTIGTYYVDYECYDYSLAQVNVEREVIVVDVLPDTSVDEPDTTDVIIINSTTSQIQIDSDDVEIDFDDLDITQNTATIQNEIVITTNIASITFPNNTEISNLNDDEIISINISEKIPTDISNIIGDIIEIGDPDMDITFNQPVRIVLPDKATGNPFYIGADDITTEFSTVCESDDFVTNNDALTDNECSIDVGDDLVIWTTHFTAYGAYFDESQDDEVTKKSGGSDNQWKTKPTFGLSHETFRQLVDGGFRFNNNTFQITDNWHTPFPAQNVTLGELNLFSAKVYAEKKLMIQEFLFGIPKVGDSHNAELGIEVWYDMNGNVTDTKIVQETNVVDPDSLIVVHEKVKCQESDNTERCDITYIAIEFLEPLQDDVMAIKAVDYKRRSQVTFLNEGFYISGDSLNPLIKKHIAGTEKHEGLITITQSSKYSNYWFAEDGRIFEANAAGSLTQINKSFERYIDSGDARDRRHSEFSTSVKEQQIIAQIVSDYLYGGQK